MNLTCVKIALLSGLMVMGLGARAGTGAGAGETSVEAELKFRAGDENGNELKALKTEMLVMHSEKKALEQLQKLLKRYQGTRMEPDMLLRLGELYMRRARTERFFEIHRGSDQIASFAPQLVKAASEKKEIVKACEIYSKIQSRFPDFASMDLVIFNNAYARQQLGDDKEAERLYLKIISAHASSPLVPDTYLAVGEINYQRRSFAVALENFKAIRKFPEARVYPYGLYKAAWSYYNLQDAASGMKQLEEVVAFGHEMAKGQIDAKLDLRKEALGDMALFFSDVYASAQAVDYFKAQARDLDAGPYVLRLTELYKRHSRYGDVAKVLKEFLRKMPRSESTPVVYDELVWNAESMKDRGGVIENLTAFDSYCAVAAGCRSKLAETGKKIAAKFHSNWKKQPAEDLAAGADKAYRIYLKNAVSDDVDLVHVRFAFAELLFARKLYREASDQYATVLAASSATTETKIQHDAAYGATVALERAVGESKWSDGDEKKFQDLTAAYLRRFPEGERGLDLQFKRAFIAYEKERYDEAAGQFKRIGWKEKSPSSEKVMKAQDLYLDILNIKKDYRALKEAAHSLLSSPVERGRAAHVESIYREAYFAEIQGLEEKGQVAAAIDAYKKFARENQSSELSVKAWWNASLLQFKSGDAMAGSATCLEMHERLAANKSPLGLECLKKSAGAYESMARLDLAAKTALLIATVEAEKADQWREIAADFQALSGGREKAIETYLKLAEGKAGEVRLRLLEKSLAVASSGPSGGANDRSNDVASERLLKQVQSRIRQWDVEPFVSGMMVTEAESALTDKDFTKAFNLAKKIIGRDGASKAAQARARFVQARVLEEEYLQQSVKGRVERIGIVLALKTEKLEKAQKAYQSAAGYGDADVAVRALKRLSACYLDYAKALRGVDLGAGVPASDLAAFKSEIESMTIPMEEKGIEAMAQALETARKADMRDGRIAELQMEINRLNLKSTKAPLAAVHSPPLLVPVFRAPVRGVAASGGG